MSLVKPWVVATTIAIIMFFNGSAHVFADSSVADTFRGESGVTETGDELSVVGENAAASESVWSVLVKLFLALFVVIALMYVLLRLLGRKNYQMQSSNTMQNIGGIPLGQNKSVQIVRIGDRLLVVGVGENIALLDEIRDEDEIERILNQKDEQTSSADWLQKLKSMKRTPEKDINIYDTLNDHLEDVDREKTKDVERLGVRR
ncbi:flagellar biosynthetic protein FliO [Geomicrobium sp. JCM 19038]|uniref:flagellar biosynthetic protein FliO n=2 Tax=unclassified Geomicrobium TaxID=2628951 RepID=UPI00045F1D12|nr:flagellar biosynthetic protein FliO [Geomicrobium sp. JCM 19038]GAK07538.1 flagellar biosynthesis protein FliZ [Geomicrobium sp. JCM 19038]